MAGCVTQKCQGAWRVLHVFGRGEAQQSSLNLREGKENLPVRTEGASQTALLPRDIPGKNTLPIPLHRSHFTQQRRRCGTGSSESDPALQRPHSHQSRSKKWELETVLSGWERAELQRAVGIQGINGWLCSAAKCRESPSGTSDIPSARPLVPGLPCP